MKRNIRAGESCPHQFSPAGFFFLFLLAIHSCLAQSARASDVIFLTVDTLRKDHVGAYNPQNKHLTPNIDALLKDSVVFDHAFSNVPITLPSFTTVFTGLYPAHHGVHFNTGFKLDSKTPVAAALFEKAGYRAIGVLGGNPLRSGKGLERGFSIYDDRFLHRPATGNPLYSTATVDQALGETSQRPAMDVTAIAAQHLKQSKGKVFLFAHYYDPHSPYAPPSSFKATGASTRYASEVAYTDFAVGQLLKTLKELKRYDDAMIVFLADHGEGLGDHNEQEHGYFLYNSTIDVPLAMKLPAKHPVRPGRNSVPVSLADVFPTVAAISGLTLPGKTDGMNLLPVMKSGKPSASPARHFFLETHLPYLYFNWEKMHGSIQWPYKAIYSSQPKVFDIVKDPGEKQNLHPSRFSELQKLASGFVSAAEKQNSTAVEEEDLERLRSLGYLGSTGKITRAPQMPPDKWHIVADAIAQGNAALYSGNYDKALELFTGFLKQYPSDYRALIQRGVVYLRMQKFKEAEKDLSAALKLNSETFEVYENLLQLFRSTGQKDKYKRLIATIPASFPPALVLPYKVENLLLQKNSAEALRILKQEIARNPGSRYAYMKYLELLIETGKKEEAASFLKSVVSNSENPSTLYLRGIQASLANKSGESVENFKKSIEAGADFFQPYFYLGQHLRRAGNLTEALKNLNAARVLAPDDPQVLYEWGDALAQKGDLAMARKVFEMATRSTPDSPQNHVALMKVQWLMQDYDSAQKEYEWLVNHAPALLKELQQKDPLVRQITE